jgi:hypothetical protein
MTKRKNRSRSKLARRSLEGVKRRLLTQPSFSSKRLMRASMSQTTSSISCPRKREMMLTTKTMS